MPSQSRSPAAHRVRVVVVMLLGTVWPEIPIWKLATAWLTYVPSLVRCTVTVTSPDAPGARLPRFQVTVPPAWRPARLAATKVVPAGSASLIVALLATPLPVLA